LLPLIIGLIPLIYVTAAIGKHIVGRSSCLGAWSAALNPGTNAIRGGITGATDIAAGATSVNIWTGYTIAGAETTAFPGDYAASATIDIRPVIVDIYVPASV
jgi:hypothetical protein